MAADLPGRLTPRDLSHALRHAAGPQMRNRRWVAGLSLFSGTIMGGIALYQLGIIHNIPEPRWPRFDAKKVNGSPEAYSILKTPDALLGAVSYAATACLAGAGDPDRSRTAPWIPIAMGVKLAGDAAVAAKLTADQWTKYHAFCLWCLLSAGATLAAALVGAREVSIAARRLWDGDQTRLQEAE